MFVQDARLETATALTRQYGFDKMQAIYAAIKNAADGGFDEVQVPIVDDRWSLAQRILKLHGYKAALNPTNNTLYISWGITNGYHYWS